MTKNTLILTLSLFSMSQASAAMYAVLAGLASPASVTSVLCSLLGFDVKGLDIDGADSDAAASGSASLFFKSYALQCFAIYGVSRGFSGYSKIGAITASMVAPLGWALARRLLQEAFRKDASLRRVLAAIACAATVGGMGYMLNECQRM